MSAIAEMADEAFFDEHRDRQARIRIPAPGEREKEFRGLGDHNRERRRIIAWKVPVGSRLMEGQILCIAFLLFADESIRDDDATLVPIIHELMMDAAKDYGIDVPKGNA